MSVEMTQIPTITSAYAINGKYITINETGFKSFVNIDLAIIIHM